MKLSNNLNYSVMPNLFRHLKSALIREMPKQVRYEPLYSPHPLIPLQRRKQSLAITYDSSLFDFCQLINSRHDEQSTLGYCERSRTTLTTIVLFLFLSLTLHAQQTFTPSFETTVEGDFFSVDALGNSYLVKGSEITKLDEKGIVVSNFSKKDFGNITSLDARDPLRIIVFYKSFATVRVLDNKLVEQSTIDLRTLELRDPTLVCSADVQGFWVYDNSTSRLTKYNAQLQAISISNDLNKTVNEKIVSTQLAESDNWLVMNNGKDVLVFDKLGNFFKPVVIPEGITQLQMMRDNLVMFSASKMTSIDLRKGDTTEMDLPLACTSCKYFVSAGHLFVLEKNKLKAFTF